MSSADGIKHPAGRPPAKDFNAKNDAVAFYKSKAWTDLAPERDKAIKVVRRFVVEVEK
jgi:hypothetical protein